MSLLMGQEAPRYVAVLEPHAWICARKEEKDKQSGLREEWEKL